MAKYQKIDPVKEMSLHSKVVFHGDKKGIPLNNFIIKPVYFNIGE